MSVNEPLDDRAWIRRCLAFLIELDPQLEPALARPIAQDMATSARWRVMPPEVAARTVFEFANTRSAATA